MSDRDAVILPIVATLRQFSMDDRAYILESADRCLQQVPTELELAVTADEAREVFARVVRAVAPQEKSSA
jgi:hypothetical protein